MKNYLVEFIGAFFLVSVIGLVVLDPGAGSLAPLAIGSALMVMVFAGGHRSGAHYNPAVTLAVFIRGKCDKKDVLPYMLAQFIAAFAATFLIGYFKGFPSVAPLTIDPTKAFIAEVLFTFALAYVVLNVATADGTSGNSAYGLSIGFTVLVGAYSVGGISGGSFNPAVALGLWGLGLYSATNLALTIVANLIGGAIAAYLFKYLESK